MAHTIDDNGSPCTSPPPDDANPVAPNRAAGLGFALVLYVVFDGFSHGMLDARLTPLVSITLLATAAALALALLGGCSRRLLTPPGARTTGIILLAFVGYTALSAVLGGGTFDLGFVKNAMLFAAIVALTDTPRRLDALLLTAAGAGMIQAGLGIGQVIVSQGVPPGGVTGLLPNHVQYAMYLLLSILALAPFVHRTHGARRLGVLAAEVLMITMLLASLARGVLVVGIICAALWLLTSLRSRRSRLLAVAGMTTTASAAFMASERLQTLLEVPAALGDPARLDVLLSGRLPLLLAAWNMWLAHPLIGVGYGRYPIVWAEYAPSELGFRGIRDFAYSAHSTYLQIAAEMGAIGLGLYLALIGSGLRDGLRARSSMARRGDSAGVLAATAILIALLAIALHGILDNTGWHDRVLYVLLAASVVVRTHTADDGLEVTPRGRLTTDDRPETAPPNT